MNSYQTIKIFTPGTPAELAFVEREKINEELVNTIGIPGYQILVCGEFGVGKSSLIINKLKQLYEKHITTICIDGMTQEDILLSAFDQLDSFYVAEKEAKTGSKLRANLKAIFGGVGAEKNEHTISKITRTAPRMASISNLYRCLYDENACWLLEDVDRLPSESRYAIGSFCKHFSNHSGSPKICMTSNEGPGEWKVFTHLHRSLRRFNLHPMCDSELLRIMDVGGKLLNITFDQAFKSKTISGARGMPGYVHEECLRLCQLNGIDQTLDKPTKLP